MNKHWRMKMLNVAAAILVLFVRASTAIASNIVDDDSRSHHADYALEDSTCFEANRAYEAMNNSGRWSTKLFELYPNGNTRQMYESRILDPNVFERNTGNDTWTNKKRTVRLPEDDNGERIFSNCRLQGVETTNGEPAIHYLADWQKNFHHAATEIWISANTRKFEKVILRFEFGSYSAHIPVVVQTMDYDRSKAIVPEDFQSGSMSSVGANIDDIDPCAAISAAFAKTFNTPRFRYKINAGTDGKHARVERAARVVDGQLYLEDSNGLWTRHYLALQLPSPFSFRICVQQSKTTKEVHYSAWITNEGPMVPIDVWVSAENGTLTRTQRNYSATGQMYHARTVTQNFAYGQPNTTPPDHYIESGPLSGFWPGDDDLR